MVQLQNYPTLRHISLQVRLRLCYAVALEAFRFGWLFFRRT